MYVKFDARLNSNSDIGMQLKHLNEVVFCILCHYDILTSNIEFSLEQS